MEPRPAAPKGLAPQCAARRFPYELRAAARRGSHRSAQDGGRLTSASAFLRIEDLHAHYGKSHVLRGVTLQVNRGEVVSLLGRNGSGRSTRRSRR